MINLLAISGSLRCKSSNTALLRAAIKLAPKDCEITLYNNLGELPFFNPDIENLNHSVITEFRKQLFDADGIIIASPEYAHGITGVLKNGLDWIVGSGELTDKPVVLLNTSGRATYAYKALTEVLTVMTASIIEKASVTIPITPGRYLTENDIITHDKFAPLIQNSIKELMRYIIQNKIICN